MCRAESQRGNRRLASWISCVFLAPLTREPASWCTFWLLRLPRAVLSGLPLLVMLGCPERPAGYLSIPSRLEDCLVALPCRKVSIACLLAVTLVSFFFSQRERSSWLEMLPSPAVAAHVASVLGRYSPFSCSPDYWPGLLIWLSILTDSPSPKVMHGNSSTSRRR